MIFEFDDYKRFLRDFIKRLPRHGHGEAGRLAKSLGTNSTFISQILNGNANLSPEQAYKVSVHFAFNQMETDYFMNLVSMNRAGDKTTENYFRQHLEKLRQQNSEVEKRLKLKSDLNDEDYFTYYSHWYYSAIWLLTAIPAYQTKETISQRLNLPLALVTNVLDFLIHAKLIEFKNNKYQITANYIHIGKDSPHLKRHHANWRHQSLIEIDQNELKVESADELRFTSPIILSKSDTKKIHELFLKCLEDFRKITAPSACEELYCLNIDWYKVGKG